VVQKAFLWSVEETGISIQTSEYRNRKFTFVFVLFVRYVCYVPLTSKLNLYEVATEKIRSYWSLSVLYYSGINRYKPFYCQTQLNSKLQKREVPDQTPRYKALSDPGLHFLHQSLVIFLAKVDLNMSYLFCKNI